MINNRFRRNLVWFIFLFFLLVSVIFMYSAIINRIYVKEILSNKLINNIPAGEITDGKKLVQRVEIPQSIKGNISLEILFATYNRTNESRLEVTLRQNDVSASKILETKTFKDNSYKRVYFEDFDLKDGEAFIEISGIDGSPGNSVTVWLTEDAPYGGILINDVQHDKSLTFKLGSSVTSPVFNITGGKTVFWIWALTYFGIISTLFVYFIRLKD